MPEEKATRISDQIFAELVDCAPPDDEPKKKQVVLHDTPQDQTPTEQSRDATLTQTGAGPPPCGSCGQTSTQRLPVRPPLPLDNNDPLDAARGLRWRAYYADGLRVSGDTFDQWASMPRTGLLLVDVDEPRLASTGRPYRFRMECEYFGCRQDADGSLRFRRWHDAEHAPDDASYHWIQGVLVSDDLMDSIRREAK